jgi:hypothetical protein
MKRSFPLTTLNCLIYADGQLIASRWCADGRSVVTPALDIFKKDVRGNPVWIDAVNDLEDARLRLNQLVSIRPGEYFVFDHRTRRIVASVARLDCDRIH